MAAPVRIATKAWSDIRFSTLARILGLADADHALIKVARLWSWQTDHYTSEMPTYAIDRDTIESVLGVGGPEALVRAQLARETPDGWRMRGTEGSIEWRSDLSAKRQRAGKVRASVAQRSSDGRMKIGKVDYCDPAHAGCAGPASTSTSDFAGPAPTSTRPAQSSALTLTLSPESTLASPEPESEIPPSGELSQRARVHARDAHTGTHTRDARAKKLPAGWCPAGSDANREAESAARGRGVDLVTELAKLRDWAAGTGSRRADWDATWRNWTRKARAECRRPPTNLELQLERVAMLEREESERGGATP